jgi:hypothetical protein
MGNYLFPEKGMLRKIYEKLDLVPALLQSARQRHHLALCAPGAEVVNDAQDPHVDSQELQDSPGEMNKDHRGDEANQ